MFVQAFGLLYLCEILLNAILTIKERRKWVTRAFQKFNLLNQPAETFSNSEHFSNFLVKLFWHRIKRGKPTIRKFHKHLNDTLNGIVYCVRPIICATFTELKIQMISILIFKFARQMKCFFVIIKIFAQLCGRKTMKKLTK